MFYFLPPKCQSIIENLSKLVKLTFKFNAKLTDKLYYFFCLNHHFMQLVNRYFS
ncbi:hypothetical protein HMPREF1872_00961 [Amygdalobacter nucleatus]|uniref:Uncharacterized protein n=1 Tax=Amygdalobacter nucleatus TaxID=3029274 RepID=A0A133YAB5_9FIRM|nr:hypothetical protein HMPREF1872_00961 [Amygdalobacter nucleatus]